MNISEFTANLQEELELEVELSPETMLNSLEEWDSMAAMIVIGYVGDNFGVILNGDDISKITDVNSLIDRIGREKFD
jgi:acyl carrier protein